MARVRPPAGRVAYPREQDEGTSAAHRAALGAGARDPAILHELEPLTGHRAWLFPGNRTNGEPMSENTIYAALRRLGYSRAQLTAHSFRSMASTMLHELGWPSDVIERQLAHAERNAVKAAYNRAEHLPVRKKLMQAWADHLDGLRKEAGPSPRVAGTPVDRSRGARGCEPNTAERNELTGP